MIKTIKSNWGLLTIGILSAITALSLWPLDNLPEVPGTDKTHHLVAYALLMLPTAISKPKGWIFIGLLFIAYSGAIELIQPIVNRHGEWADLAANSAGILLGVFVAMVINKIEAITSNTSK